MANEFYASYGDIEARLRCIESWAKSAGRSPVNAAVEANAIIIGGNNASAGTGGLIPETTVVFDAADGHDHDGTDSKLITLAGDVSGTNAATSVDKVKAVDAPVPASTDDGKKLQYLHSSVDYVLRHTEFLVVNKVFGDSPYTATAHNSFITVNATGGAVTINLPAVSGLNGRCYIVKKTDVSVNAVTIDGAGAETIDGAATKVLAAQYDVARLVCDGSVWHLI